MRDGDRVVVAADDEGRAFDMMELIEGDVGLIIVQVDDLLLTDRFGGAGLFVNVYVFLCDQPEYEGGETEGVGRQVGACEGHFFDLFRMADGHLQCNFSAQTVTKYIGTVCFKIFQ